MKNFIIFTFFLFYFSNINAQCQANFSYTQNGPTTYFTDLSTINQSWSTNYSVTWEWDFGDGTPISTMQNPMHTYVNNGIYTPCLTVIYFDSVVINTCISVYCDSILIGNGPAASWDCAPSGCFDPGNGIGQYNSLSACQAACTILPSWDCNPNTFGCYDPGNGFGQYPSLSACQIACGTQSWDCSPSGCFDPGNGLGTYTSLSACQVACVTNSSSLCDSIIVSGSQTQLSMQVNNINSIIDYWISSATDGTILGEDSMWNTHLVYNSFTLPYDTITTCITYMSSNGYVTCCVSFIWDSSLGIWAKIGLPTSTIENQKERELVKVIDFLGKENKFRKNKILFYIYDDGSVEKKLFK
tara:strand:- start:28 stop:1095 length:1068 start_codon:yes stop_codon:yes gene_type:complete